jgi:hypothetical protein
MVLPEWFASLVLAASECAQARHSQNHLANAKNWRLSGALRESRAEQLCSQRYGGSCIFNGRFSAFLGFASFNL